MNRQNRAGFTIIELMLTIAIAAVLLAVAVPSYTNMVLNNCLTAKTNQLVSAMQLARSTAVTFRDEVTVGSISCQLDEDNNNAADGSCATADRQDDEFGEGVVVYRDLDGDGFADLEADEDADGDGATIMLRLDRQVPADVLSAIGRDVNAVTLEVVDLS